MTMTLKDEPVSAESVVEPWGDAPPKFRGFRWNAGSDVWRGHLLSFFKGFSIVVAVFVIAWPLLPRKYESTATIVLHPSSLESESDSAPFLKQPLDENAIQSEIDQISSPVLASIVVAKQQIADDPEFSGGWKRWIGLGAMTDADLRRSLLSHLAVSKGRRSYTVKFGFMSADPAKAAALTQTLLDAYLAEQSARKRKVIDELTGLLTERVAQLRAKSDASQRALQTFLVQSGLIDRGAKINLEQELQTLSTEAALARSQAVEAQARFDALVSLQKAGRLDSAPEVLASPVIQKLKDKLAGAKSIVSPVEMPQRAIDDHIAAEADRIVRSVKTQSITATDRELALERAIGTIREELVRRQNSELELVAIRRDAEADRKALDDALVRLAAQTARASSVVPDVDVVALPEVPTQPQFPNLLLTVLAALVAGCLAGAFTVRKPLSQWALRLTTR